jgi:ssDNA-binding replication factor A large subunit
MSEEEGQAAGGAGVSAPNVKVSELGPYSKQVNTSVKVVQKGEARETVSRQDGTTHRVLDALVGDDTGTIYMTLWDENIDKVNEGDSVNVKNGYVRPFKGSMRLNIGRYGSLEPAETPLGDVNTTNNLSDKVVEERPYRSYGGGRRFGGGGGGYGGGRGGGYGGRGGGGGGYGRGGGGGYGGGRGRGRGYGDRDRGRDRY